MDSQKVWAPDINDGYVLGQIVDIGPNGVTVQSSSANKVKFILKKNPSDSHLFACF
jgi:hypothetical protein